MTAPRINLAALRFTNDDRNPDAQAAARSSDVLALVEAVEAAQALTTNPLSPGAHRRLRAALAPFVEGDE